VTPEINALATILLAVSAVAVVVVALTVGRTERTDD
jgi:ABC-type spermidine/putrescine transport system permease subunit II